MVGSRGGTTSAVGNGTRRTGSLVSGQHQRGQTAVAEQVVLDYRTGQTARNRSAGQTLAPQQPEVGDAGQTLKALGSVEGAVEAVGVVESTRFAETVAEVVPIEAGLADHVVTASGAGGAVGDSSGTSRASHTAIPHCH